MKSSLLEIPWIGKSIAEDFNQIGIFEVTDLVWKNPQELFDTSNKVAWCIQDRCLLYTFRCAVYFANTPKELHEKEKLKWWNWKD
jgi:nucleotidyltransferase/DNA polymerase involved in DNA repair